MATNGEDGAAAEAKAGERAVAPRAVSTLEGAPAADWQAAVAQLVDLATDILRRLHGGTPALAAAAGLDVDRATRAEPSLLALRRFLDDHADGIAPVDEDDERPRRAAATLRSLLEIVLETSIPLPGEVGHIAAAPDDLDRLTQSVAGLTVTDRDRTWTVRNLTARHLTLQGRDGAAWIVPAFGRRALDDDPRVELDLRDALARGELDVSEPRQKSSIDFGVLGGVYVWLVIGAFVAGNLWGWWGWALAAVVLAIPIASALVISKGEWQERLWAFTAELPARLVQLGTFLIVLAIGVAVPAAVIVFGADLRDTIRHVVDLEASRDEYLTVVCRSMQLVLISIASLLPALLYYQFDRDRLSTLREKFVHQIFRLDSSMTTLGAIDAKYGRLIDEIYGAERTGRYRKLLPGRRAPILVATVLIMLGWLLVLLNPDVGLVTSEAAISGLFDPRRTAPAFAFLGAYFFALFALLRGYVRRDLRPKSYSDISVRIIAVVILAWVLELLFVDDSEGLLVFAFLTGLVPQAALNVIREFWQRQLTKWTYPKEQRDAAAGSNDDVSAALADPLPLTNLEGIDLYDRTRLASEGVTNIEALAHHDLVELMLLTRIPVPRLVDWTDQAVLHLHVGAADRATLQRYGIRTASDLMRAYDCAKDRKALDELLGLLDADPQARPQRMQVILDAIGDEEWIASIRHWHGQDSCA